MSSILWLWVQIPSTSCIIFSIFYWYYLLFVAELWKIENKQKYGILTLKSFPHLVTLLSSTLMLPISSLQLYSWISLNLKFWKVWKWLLLLLSSHSERYLNMEPKFWIESFCSFAQSENLENFAPNFGKIRQLFFTLRSCSHWLDTFQRPTHLPVPNRASLDQSSKLKTIFWRKSKFPQNEAT